MSGHFDYSDLMQYQKKLEKLEKELPKFNEKMVKELASRLLRMVKYRTPVISGELRRNWTIGEITTNGAKITVDVINPTEYAIYVEYGHRQTPGRYVPAIGKRLVSGWVTGRFMLTKSEALLEGRMAEIVEARLVKWLGEQLS